MRCDTTGSEWREIANTHMSGYILSLCVRVRTFHTTHGVHLAPLGPTVCIVERIERKRSFHVADHPVNLMYIVPMSSSNCTSQAVRASENPKQLFVQIGLLE